MDSPSECLANVKLVLDCFARDRGCSVLAHGAAML